jgi:hypothetical protein
MRFFIDFVKKGVASEKPFAYIALLAEGNLASGKASS